MEDEVVSGQVVPAPEAARASYEDPARALRVLVRVDYADGRVREYEAREPQGFRISDPESVTYGKYRIGDDGTRWFRPVSVG